MVLMRRGDDIDFFFEKEVNTAPEIEKMRVYLLFFNGLTGERLCKGN
jgi:hypothetical protein